MNIHIYIQIKNVGLATKHTSNKNVVTAIMIANTLTKVKIERDPESFWILYITIIMYLLIVFGSMG
uniref:Uncharacterized protein n=1 Tax=Leersia perrieri TaxID=77586 RepID=A0A0D9XPB1_9ORYZ